MRLALALSVGTVGFASAGCLYIPTTRGLVENGDGHHFTNYGKPRPKSLVGRRPDQSIHLGQTRLADALIAVQGSVLPNGWYEQLLQMVEISDDARVWAVRYPLRIGFWTDTPTEGRYCDIAWRQFVLEADDTGVVVSTRSTDCDTGGMFEIPTPLAKLPPERLFTVFTEADRAKLRAAGILPSDAELAKIVKAQQQATPRPPR